MQGDELMGIIARITLFSVQGVSERDTPLKLFASRLFVRPRRQGTIKSRGMTDSNRRDQNVASPFAPRMSPDFHRHGLLHPGRSAVLQLSKAPSVVGR